ncbi:MAG TPA: sugar ABC transporter substrate-binding protein [Gaiellaceae bacterium]
MRKRALRAWTRGLAALAVSGALAVTLVAASSSSASSQLSPAAGIAAAKKLVAQYEKPPKWAPPGKPFDASKAKGKSIWYVSLSLSIPFEQYMLQGIKQGAASVGAKGVGFDGKFSAAEGSRGIEQAIQSKASVIMVGGFEPSLVGPALEHARKAGIPVIMANVQDPGPPRKDYPPAVKAFATHSFSWPGKAEADFITVDSNGKANILFMSTSDLPHITGPEKDAFLNELKRVCPGCKTEVMNVPSGQWNTLQTKTASLIRSHPDVDYIVPDFDGMVIFALPGVHSAGATSKVKIVSFNATPSVMKALKNKDVVVAETGGPNLLQGWAFADQALRVAAGVPALKDIGIEDRLFTANNINSINLNAEESTWYGEGNYVAAYKKLWGVK